MDWVEAISENHLAPGGRPNAVLEKVRGELPVVLHGVSLAVGSVDPLDERLLARTPGAGSAHRARLGVGPPLLGTTRRPLCP